MTAFIDYDAQFEQDYTAWFAGEIDTLTDSTVNICPSDWAEKNRYLPKSVTPMPGYYSYDVNPALREIIDCGDIHSPIREVAFKKGAQIGATVGVLENLIGYGIDILKSSPFMLMTVDDGVAKIRMENYITPMIQQSDLEDRIRSSDEGNARKTGKTDKKIEWAGGGFLLPFGANSAGKLRSISIQYLLQDECDGYPIKVGKDGDPGKLAEARTNAFKRSRKIFKVSTPLIEGQSPITDAFLRGDQRYYHVPCKKCGKEQVLRFQGVDQDTGVKWGLVWDTDDDGDLVPGSVRYLCQYCQHPHVNADKIDMLPAGRWIPTAKPANPYIRSYHLSALYSPSGMYDWEAIVNDWYEAWDVQNNRVKDVEKLQTFYNNNLGETYEVRGDKLQFVTVSAHRRNNYLYGQVPNNYAINVTGSEILMLTMAVDVHDDNLAVAVMGWTAGRRCFLVDYWRFHGKCDDIYAEPWQQVYKLHLEQRYQADDGKVYPIALTLIDSSYKPNVVYEFCNQFMDGVYPIQGREIKTNALTKEFGEFKTPFGSGYGLTVDLYKDRWATALRRPWDGDSLQPPVTFNAPMDCTDKQIKELTAERKVEVVQKTTGKRVGFEWKRSGGVDNELWDLLVYNNAAYDLLCWDTCINTLELEQPSFAVFDKYAAENQLYYFAEAA